MTAYITTNCSTPEFTCCRCNKQVKDHCWTWAGVNRHGHKKYCSPCGHQLEARIAKKSGGSVCIEDLAGNNRQPGFWADWWPAEAVTRFGGAWGDAPDMPSPTRPTEHDCLAWVKQHDPDWNVGI